MAIIHRIGMPENDSEARAIKRLSRALPDNYFVFHNFVRGLTWRRWRLLRPAVQTASDK